MLVTTKAIVFSALKYAEADLIVTCFTESSGLRSYLLRNILKSKKNTLKTSYFQPLTQLELITLHRDKGTLEHIKEARIINPYQNLHTQVVKGTLVIFIAEMLKNSIKEEGIDKVLYSYLENALNWLDNHEDIANFHILFLLKLSTYLGFYPDTSAIDKEYFNLLEGNFQSSSTNNYCEKGKAVKALKQFFGIDFDAVQYINLTKKLRLNTLNLLIMYYQLHLHNFQKPKSLLVLNQIFQ